MEKHQYRIWWKHFGSEEWMQMFSVFRNLNNAIARAEKAKQGCESLLDCTLHFMITNGINPCPVWSNMDARNELEEMYP